MNRKKILRRSFIALLGVIFALNAVIIINYHAVNVVKLILDTISVRF